MLVYPVLLVQQGTGKRGGDTRASEFRLNHRHLEIGAGGGVDSAFPGFHGLDFKHEAVRRERFALTEETLQRYPVDGIELQLNYMPLLLPPRRSRVRTPDHDRVDPAGLPGGQAERRGA